jgi:hypothetical protein
MFKSRFTLKTGVSLGKETIRMLKALVCPVSQ